MEKSPRVAGAVLLTTVFGIGLALCVAGLIGHRVASFAAALPLAILFVCAVVNWTERT